MPLYKKKVTKRGQENFYKDGKYLKRHEVPEEILGIEPDVAVEFPKKDTIEEVSVTPAEYHGPISYLSGEPAVRRKWLNQKVYWLTEEEFQKYNLGKLAEAVRNKDAETVAERA